MKLLSSFLLLASATAQLTTYRLLRTSTDRDLRKGKDEQSNDAAEVAVESLPEDEVFGRFDLLLTSVSMSVPTSSPVEASDMPSPEPTPYPTTFTDAPTPSTPAPVVVTASPTLSKAGKENKKELLAYSWDLPAEYIGIIELYEGRPKKGRRGEDDESREHMELIDIIELGAGTSGTDATYLPRGEYTAVVVNKDSATGFCCEGTSAGWVHFHYGGVEYNTVENKYQEKKDKDKFIAEFHKNPKKVEVGSDGAFYEFSFNL